NSYTEGTYTQSVDKFIDENTDLTPFRKSETAYWTSKLVRHIKTLGYTYPELEKNLTPDELLRSMLRYYHPNLYLQDHWRLTLIVQKNKVGCPFQIRVFLDLPTANASTPTSSPNFAGLMSIFARGKETQCANCKRNVELRVRGNVDLTSCMERLFIDTNPESTRSLEPRQITLVAVLKDGCRIGLEQAGLISATYWSINEGSEYNLDPESWEYKLRGQVYPPKTSQ
ncbi:21319_t:CDS:2, partial [Racocetra persica]